MATVTRPAVLFDTAADMLEYLGDVPPERILVRPAFGTATEEDVAAALDGRPKRLCELVAGFLVEKAMGTREARLATFIARMIDAFASEHDLGLVWGANGPVRLAPGLVRMPDVSFASWDRVPGGELPDDAITGVIPDLAVEVLSRKNTPKEMKRKLGEYFAAGVRLVWLVYPRTQTAEAYSSVTDVRRVGKKQALDGGGVLPGFTLPLPEVFASTRRRRGR
jgi:Uma2 family endonuclease